MQRSPWWTAILVATSSACGSGGDAPDGGGAPSDASLSSRDASQLDAAPDPSHYRTSLSSCWNDVSCQRALLVAHGGEWHLVDPAYGTTAAYDAAYADGTDAIKADVRLSHDGVPVVVHSSPFQSYEIDPLDFSCLGSRVEQMAVADIVACRWINGDHIQRLDALLTWARGKVVLMLTVKDPTTIPQTIAAVIASNATDYAFLEVSTASMTTIVPNAIGHGEVDFLVEAASQADVTTLLGLHDPRLFMIEDANSDGFGGLPPNQVSALIDGELHPAHVRAFSSISSVSASASDHQAMWNEGFDVVMTNSFAAGHGARLGINTARGVSPP